MRTQGGGVSAVRAAQLAPLFVPMLVLPITVGAWAAMPNAETEFAGLTTTRKLVDLTGKTSFKIQALCGTPGEAAAKIRIKYSVDSWATSTTIEVGAGTTGDCPLAGGLNLGALTSLVAGAKDIVQIAAFGVGGNGVTSPTFGLVAVTFT